MILHVEEEDKLRAPEVKMKDVPGNYQQTFFPDNLIVARAYNLMGPSTSQALQATRTADEESDVWA